MADHGGFPVGYHNLHPDVTLNFQLNRFWNWVGESQMLEELRRVAPSLRDYAEWTRELLALGVAGTGRGPNAPGGLPDPRWRVLHVGR
jgi:hypothetical protein